MKIIQVDKPLIGKRTGIGKAYDALLKNTELKFQKYPLKPKK